ncbi:MAG: hypothetical protein R2741_14105 [Methanolobus sp.]
MKKLMILGAAKSQIPIIKLAKKQGFETIVVSAREIIPVLNLGISPMKLTYVTRKKYWQLLKKSRLTG